MLNVNIFANLYNKMGTYRVTYAPFELQAYGKDEIAAVVNCLHAGWLAGNGKLSHQFEQAVAEYFGKRFGLFVNSGSSALEIAAQIIDLEPLDEIITPALTFNTSVAPFVRKIQQTQHGVLRFCDVEINRYVPTVEQVLAQVNEHTRIVLIPNLVGAKPNWEALRRQLPTRVILIEDSADTMTTTEHSDIAICSFYSSHVITAGGCGGVFMCNRSDWMTQAQVLCHWGRQSGANDTDDVHERFSQSIDGIPFDWKFTYPKLGYNFKASEMNAAFGLAQMARLDEILAQRRRIMDAYMTQLQDTGIVLPVDYERYNWMAIPLQYANRSALLYHLEQNGVQTRVLFAGNITRHPAFAEYRQAYENCDTIMANGFLLGAHHGMTVEDVTYVCRLIKSFVSAIPESYLTHTARQRP